MSDDMPNIELGIALANIMNKLESIQSTSEERWQQLNAIIDQMHVGVMENIDRIFDKLDTIETTVDNIESNMPVESDDE